jgi:nicotinamide riboside kinase
MKQFKKYAIIGSHSSGKCTFAMNLAYRLRTKGENVDIVQERVRYSPFPFNDKATPETAYWLYHMQICRELEAQSRGFNYIICDRAAIDCIIYGKYNKFEGAFFDSIASAADEWMYSYDKIFLLRPDTAIVTDGVRSSNEQFRNIIDNMFKNYIKDFKKEIKATGPEIIEIKTSELIDKEFNNEWIA